MRDIFYIFEHTYIRKSMDMATGMGERWMWTWVGKCTGEIILDHSMSRRNGCGKDMDKEAC